MIEICDHPDDMSRRAAERFIEIAHTAILERGRLLTALCGGDTPKGLFKLLASDAHRPRIDWSRVHFFWGDERCVPADDPGSNYGAARLLLLDQIQAPPANIHRIESELDPAEAARRYALTLQIFADPPLHWPRLDLVLLGLGEDGHTASLFPGSSVEMNTATLPVTANYRGRPANRVTMTPLVINSARNILFLVTGESKAPALFKVLKGEHNPRLYPAQRIQPAEGRVFWLVDRTSAGLIN